MNRRQQLFCGVAVLAFALAGSTAAVAQITSNAGDGVLNAPYRGTITSLREICADIPYGEVETHCEPATNITITSGTYSVWVDGTWDRSILRLYEGVDASGTEVDLTGTSQGQPLVRSVPGTFIRMSVKAIATRTTAPQQFTVKFSYNTSGGWSTPTRVFTVAPMTGSFNVLPGESEAFHLGTPILNVAVGAAQLVVPVGRTAEMIGAAFEDKRTPLGPSSMARADVLFPGAAESAYIQYLQQFRLNDSNFAKTAWGTPWPGHLIGYYTSGDTWGPDGTHYDSDTTSSSVQFWRFDRVRPRDLSNNHPAAQQLAYDNSTDNRVTQIRDGASPNNTITLQRTAGVVTRITTSDGRGWDIGSDPVTGCITSVDPDSGQGKRSFVYNSARRVTQVKDASDQLMYEFAYANDGSGNPTVLTTERRYIQAESALRDAVTHEEVGPYQLRRKEYTATGEYRQYDFFYDDTNQLKHRLARVRAYRDLNGAGPAYDTVYTHDINKAAGAMVITQVTLPDTTTIAYEYDHHLESGTVHFGFRSKATHTGASGSLVTYDTDWDFFYNPGSGNRLYWRPRIIAERDGRGYAVNYQYEEGGQDSDLEGLSDGLTGEQSNDLLRRYGPAITQGYSGTRSPETRYYYYNTDPEPVRRVLKRVETNYASGAHRDVAYQYDSLLRRRFETVAPGGASLVTEYQYTDNLATQDRVVIDADGYWTKTQFDPDGRVWKVIRYLTPGGVTTDFYQTENVYDAHGRLYQQLVDNKDQDGVPIVGETNPIVTQYTYDRLGRLTLRALDPGGSGHVNQLANFTYNWLGQTTREYDSTGRGVKHVFDGRGLVKEEIPLAAGQTETPALHTLFTYDANGRFETLTKPTGAAVQKVYDSFGRLRQDVRLPSAGPVTNNATVYEYDNASHVTRTTVRDNVTVGQPNTGTVISDTTAQYDEGGFNYETRQRLVVGTDLGTDPLTQRKFDWAGNVTEEKSLGDSTVTDRTLTTSYDTAGRVEKVQNSLGGETWYHDRDGRGNVEELWIKLQGTNYAVTSTLYDALSRAIEITDPEDATGLRHYRERFYDSRGNPRRETARTSAGVAKQTTIWDYDNASRLEFQAVLADPDGTELTGEDVDRVVGYQYWDADGRLRYRSTYNANDATPLNAETTYDNLGRVEYTYDAAREYTKNVYDPSNGRLDHREIWDGVGTRTIAFAYDGHDRVQTQTQQGDGAVADLVTTYEYDALDRPFRMTSPKGIATRTDYDLTGQRIAVVENEGGGVLERQTEYGYNRLNQLILQTAHNWDSAGGNATTQLTRYRWDPLGRLLRTFYPDTTDVNFEATVCSDCVRAAYDNAGRMTDHFDQRGRQTVYAYDDRGLVLSRTTTGYPAEAFGYDALARLVAADRGNTTIDRDYTALGDLDYEIQAIAGGTQRTVNYTQDQAGNVTQLTYPNATTVTYTHTPLNLVATVWRGTQVRGSYDYYISGLQGLETLPGRMLASRRTTTSAGNVVYDTGFGYDGHRRTDLIDNLVEIGGTPQTVASYRFTHDLHGNPLTQSVSGQPAFATDNRTFVPDDLDRLVATAYGETATVEESAFDLVGNREEHTDRARVTTAYGAVDAANEYSTIASVPVDYDETGNLCHDEDGRGYEYDEQNRLTRVFVDTNSNCTYDGGETQLAAYTYDALGRKVTATIGAVTTRFYYDGQRVIEERDAGDAVVRYHVNGGQFIDEHIATYDVAKAGGKDDGRAAGWTYYLPNANYSVAGTGDASGTTIERLDYSASGDFASGPAGTYAHDADADADIDLLDFANLQVCFGTTVPACLDIHDFDLDGQSNGVINIDDFDGFAQCFNGPDFAPQPGCEVAPAKARSTTPETGMFTLHGRPIDVLPDGKVLMDFRTRIYDPQHGRWLQRDGSGYGDGSSLYEAFRTNAARFRDPLGRQSSEDWDMTWEMLRRYFTPEGWMQRAEEKAMGLPPQAPDPVARAVFERIEVANDVAAEVARTAQPYVRPVLQGAAVVGGTAQAAAGVVIIVAPHDLGLGDVAGAALVMRGGDVAMTNAYGLYTGTIQPTALWLLVNRAAGPEAASLTEFGVDVALLPASLEALPIRGPAPAFSSTATFAGSRALAPVAAGSGVLDRLALQSQRALRFVVGEEKGYVLGMGLSPGELGSAAPGRQLIFSFAEPTPPSVVFRVLRADENPALGLFAKNPSANYTLQQHLMFGNTLRTRFISATRSVSVARSRALGDQAVVVAIDLSRVSPSQVIDVSTIAAQRGLVTNPTARLYALESAEVIFIEQVPAEAILDYVPLVQP